MSSEITGPCEPADEWKPNGDEEPLRLNESDWSTVVTALKAAQAAYLDIAERIRVGGDPVAGQVLGDQFEKQAREAVELKERIREAVGL